MTAPQLNGKGGADGGPTGWAAFRTLWNAQESTVGRRAIKPRLGPGLRGAAVACWVLALVITFLAWNGAGKWPYVALQMPYVISGALTVIVLSFAGAALFVSSFLADLVHQMATTPAPPTETRTEPAEVAPAAQRDRDGSQRRRATPASRATSPPATQRPLSTPKVAGAGATRRGPARPGRPRRRAPG